MSKEKHEHEHHAHTHEHSAGGNILTALFLNLLFVFIEIAGGFWTNSISILMDAVHDFGDCLTIGCAYFLEKLSGKPADARYTYGYRRYSALSAIISALVLVIGSIIAVVAAIKRIAAPEEVRSLGMLAIAVLGVVINGIAVLRTSRGEGSNERVISLHMLEDVLGWGAVLIGSILIKITGLYILDPILSICVAVFVLWHAAENVIEVMPMFLERAPADFDMDGFKGALAGVENVSEIHHVHVWSAAESAPVATLHAVVPGELTSGQADRVRSDIRGVCKSFGIEHVTVQTESESCGTPDCG